MFSISLSTIPKNPRNTLHAMNALKETMTESTISGVDGGLMCPNGLPPLNEDEYNLIVPYHKELQFLVYETRPGQVAFHSYRRGDNGTKFPAEGLFQNPGDEFLYVNDECVVGKSQGDFETIFVNSLKKDKSRGYSFYRMRNIRFQSRPQRKRQAEISSTVSTTVDSNTKKHQYTRGRCGKRREQLERDVSQNKAEIERQMDQLQTCESQAQSHEHQAQQLRQQAEALIRQVNDLCQKANECDASAKLNREKANRQKDALTELQSKTQSQSLELRSLREAELKQRRQNRPVDTSLQSVENSKKRTQTLKRKPNQEDEDCTTHSNGEDAASLHEKPLQKRFKSMGL